MTLKKVLSTAQFAAGGIVLARCVGSRKGKGRWGGRNGCVGFVLDVSWWRYLQSSTLHFNVARLVHDVHVVLYEADEAKNLSFVREAQISQLLLDGVQS